MKHLIPTLLGIWFSSISFSAETKPFPPEGLRLWLMADAGITTEDNSKEGGSKTDIARWTDQSEEGIELTPAYKSPTTRPTLVKKVSEIGGKPALQFNGKGGSNFEVTDSLIGRFKKSFNLNRGTVFLVASMPFVPTISPLTLSATADSKTGRGGLGIRRGGKSDGWFCVHYGGPGNGKKIQSQESKLDTKFHILTVRFDKHKSELEMIVDGKNTGTKLRDQSKLPLDPIRFIQVGGHGILDPPGDPGAEWFFNGQIAEILVFDRILGNDPKIGPFAAVGNYLQRKYRIRGDFIKPTAK
mgnify:CR=1 FL=1|jgi:hypothetical protein